MRKYEEVDVGPELAHEWLQNNPNNRNMRPRVVDAYARDMKAGRWRGDNGEGIKLSWDGSLLDGQHRLAAIVKADVNIRMLVISGVDPATQDNMDVGYKRTAADQLRRQKIPNATFVAATARNLIMWKRHGLRRSFSNVTVPTPEVVEFGSDKDFLATCEIAADYRREVLAPGAVIGLCFCVFAEIDQDDAIRFFDALASGANLASKDPRLMLRNRLADIAAQRSGVYLSTERFIALFCKAWNHWREGRPMALLRVRDDEAYPEPK